MSELRDEYIHVIESAYQDVNGVRAGKKGYRLRHEELADHLEKLLAQHDATRKAQMLEAIKDETLDGWKVAYNDETFEQREQCLQERNAVRAELRTKLTEIYESKEK